jgi:hypothetical protein
MNGFSIPAVPAEFHWKHAPLDWKVDLDHRLTILAGAGTNWFIDPAGNRNQDSAPAALFTPPDASFLLSARRRLNRQTWRDGKRWVSPIPG